MMRMFSAHGMRTVGQHQEQDVLALLFPIFSDLATLRYRLVFVQERVVGSSTRKKCMHPVVAKFCMSRNGLGALQATREGFMTPRYQNTEDTCPKANETSRQDRLSSEKALAFGVALNNLGVSRILSLHGIDQRLRGVPH